MADLDDRMGSGGLPEAGRSKSVPSSISGPRLLAPEVHARAYALLGEAVPGRTKLTPARIDVFAVLLASGAALDAAQIQKRMTCALNIVTVYRTIHWLQRLGVIAATFDDRGVQRYFVKQDRSLSIMFECQRCSRLIPLPGVSVAELRALPPGIVVRQMKVSLNGTCASCAVLIKGGS